MEKLIALLNLPKDSGEEAILKRVAVLVEANDTLTKENKKLLEAPPESDLARIEKRIARKIAESAGALSREQAVLAIAHQDEAAADATRKPSPKASKK